MKRQVENIFLANDHEMGIVPELPNDGITDQSVTDPLPQETAGERWHCRANCFE